MVELIAFTPPWLAMTMFGEICLSHLAGIAIGDGLGAGRKLPSRSGYSEWRARAERSTNAASMIGQAS